MYIIQLLQTYREVLSQYWDTLLPAPHVSLLKGMTFGYDEISEIPVFKAALVSAGLIHVVVVSGYNITLVASFIERITKKKLGLQSHYVSIIFTFIYALFTGMQPPVLRAWLMYFFLQYAKLKGRKVPIVLVILITCFAVYFISKESLFSLSYMLSMSATIGLFTIASPIKSVLKNLLEIRWLSMTGFGEDLIASLSASALVWPIISYNFGTVCLLAPLINMFILWTVPISTMLGFLLCASSLIDIVLHLNISHPFSLLGYLFCDLFVAYSFIWIKVPFITIEWRISLIQIVIYYTFLALGVYLTQFYQNRKASTIINV